MSVVCWQQLRLPVVLAAAMPVVLAAAKGWTMLAVEADQQARGGAWQCRLPALATTTCTAKKTTLPSERKAQ